MNSYNIYINITYIILIIYMYKLNSDFIVSKFYSFYPECLVLMTNVAYNINNKVTSNELHTL